MREVFLPRTLDELWEILEREPRPAIYAGGTDLLVRVRARSLDPSALICIERVEELQGVREQDDAVFIGATSTHSRLRENPVIARWFPVLTKGLSALGSPPVRHMGTIGGNIVTASPAGDTLPALHVLSAEVEICSARRLQTIGDTRFHSGTGKGSAGPTRSGARCLAQEGSDLERSPLRESGQAQGPGMCGGEHGGSPRPFARQDDQSYPAGMGQRGTLRSHGPGRGSSVDR